MGVGEQIQIYDCKCKLMNGGGGRLLAYITCRRRKRVKRISYSISNPSPNRIQHRYIYSTLNIYTYTWLGSRRLGLGFAFDP